MSSKIASKAIIDTRDLPTPDLRVDASLVLIPVHVTTEMGASVTSLEKEHFRLFEDGKEQAITHFAKDDAPVSIGLVFDQSGSMHNKMKKSTEAAAAFFKTSNPGDEFFLVEFSDRPKLTIPFTQDPDELYHRISRLRPIGRTSLFDAIHMALMAMKDARNQRKALVIVSDGGDNRSRYNARQVKNALLETDVQIFAMGIFEADPDVKKLSPEEIHGPEVLDELAEQTGGRSYPVENLNDLPSISERIGLELRNQYLLGYSPTNLDRDGKYRRVRLDVSPPPALPRLRTFYRTGYYAPAQ